MYIQKELFQYVFDTSALINIKRNRKMKFLQKRKGGILIPEKVAEEINHPMVHIDDPLRKFISKYPEVVTSFENNEEDGYLRIRSQPGIHDGEASAMAIALKRNHPLVIDEKDTKATGKARNHGINTLNWQEFLERV
jgi:predicted nucleic acid-binding protein